MDAVLGSNVKELGKIGFGGPLGWWGGVFEARIIKQMDIYIYIYIYIYMIPARGPQTMFL